MMRNPIDVSDAGATVPHPDPVRRTQEQMKQALPRRFYSDAVALETADGFVIHLDGKPVRTPGKALLAVPSRKAAELVAAEFLAQEEVINPVSMPVLRIINSAIDGVAADLQAVVEDVIRFSASDLICYRAEAPEALVVRQALAWNPVLDWARSALDAQFFLAEGIMHIEQPQKSLDAVASWLQQRQDPFRLASIHVMTTLSGSALLALAVDAGALAAEQAWVAAHVDEDWNSEQWGEDDESIARRQARHREFNAAVTLGLALQGSD